MFVRSLVALRIVASMLSPGRTWRVGPMRRPLNGWASMREPETVMACRRALRSTLSTPSRLYSWTGSFNGRPAFGSHSEVSLGVYPQRRHGDRQENGQGCGDHGHAGERESLGAVGHRNLSEGRETRLHPRSSAPTGPPFSAERFSRQAAVSGSALESRHHVLDARVLLQRVHRQVLAVARLLEAAVRHLGHQRDMAVDPHAAEVERP